MHAYESLDRLLREDNGSGVLLEGSGTELIRFPGRKDEAPELVSLLQQGELDGDLVRVGGVAEWVPVSLQTDEETQTAIYARRSVAKPLARHLFEPVRLYGTGRWTRSAAGDWRLERFVVDRFDVLGNRPLSSLIVQLRALSGDGWGENAVGDLIALRQGELPAQ